MTKNGYTQRIITAIQKANLADAGPELGRLCVEKGYSVIEVAEVLGVSRQSVYSWITGKNKPSKKREEQIRALIFKLRYPDA